MPSLGLLAASFGRAGTVGPPTVPAGACVPARRRGRTLRPRVSEPPRTGEPLWRSSTAVPRAGWRGRTTPSR
ncbi:hypothetical protein [Streptomyces sp. NPDC096152]|uniref:hypothetical protein n=1 Tax=Streptomyces sp. NPDC096152 TaxID=3366078 RepID=UPI00380677FB